MSYKVVQTTENDGELCLSTVPTGWESKNTLCWPSDSSNVNTLRKNPRSLPAANWEKMPCIVKQFGIKTLKEALEHEKRLSNYLDTEDEYAQNTTRLYNRSHPGNQLLQRHDYSELLNDVIELRTNDVPIQENVVSIPETLSEDVNYITPNSEVNSGFVLLNSENQSNYHELLQINRSISDKIDRLEETSITQNENMKGIVNFLASMKITLDNIMKNLNVDHNNELQPPPSNQYVKDVLPITTQEEIDSLENKLIINKTFRTDFINQLSKVGGVTGCKDAKSFMYLLLDTIFSKNFINTCSWTGASKKSINKIPFQKYSNIIECFYVITQLADSRHSICDNINFLKKILKNSQKRTLIGIKNKPNHSTVTAIQSTTVNGECYDAIVDEWDNGFNENQEEKLTKN